MSIIITEKLNKEFRRFKKEEGLKGSIKSLFKREYIEKKDTVTWNRLKVKYDGVGI